jgi:hypothetical protein
MKHGSRGQGSGQRPAHACRDDGCLRVCAVAFTVGSSMARSSFRRIAKGSARNRKNAQARLAYRFNKYTRSSIHSWKIHKPVIAWRCRQSNRQ